MSAVLSPSFGNPSAVRDAAIGNACYYRAIRLGYGDISAHNFARLGKKQAISCESPVAVALRVVPPKTHSATRGRGPTGGFAA